jgi:hypothetical protein
VKSWIPLHQQHQEQQRLITVKAILLPWRQGKVGLLLEGKEKLDSIASTTPRATAIDNSEGNIIHIPIRIISFVVLLLNMEDHNFKFYVGFLIMFKIATCYPWTS